MFIKLPFSRKNRQTRKMF